MKRTRSSNSDPMPDSSKSTLPSSVIVKFSKHDGTSTGNPIEIPIQSTSAQLEILLNSLLDNDEKVIIVHCTSCPSTLMINLNFFIRSIPSHFMLMKLK